MASLFNLNINTTFILILQILFVLISIAIIPTTTLMDFAAIEDGMIWKTAASWLRPPYVYFIINAIIVTIVATSQFQQQSDAEDMKMNPPVPPPDDVHPPLSVYREPPEIMTMGIPVVEYTLPEMPLASARFGHLKPLKPALQGKKALGGHVTKSKRHETLESTWKMITESHQMSSSHHQQKIDNWYHQNHQLRKPINGGDVDGSSLLEDHSKILAPLLSEIPTSARMHTESSLSKDELNRRVEAFIKKFNEEMKLERQKSLDQYYEMINRATY